MPEPTTATHTPEPALEPKVEEIAHCSITVEPAGETHEPGKPVGQSGYHDDTVPKP